MNFLAEKDGDSERELKRRLVAIFNEMPEVHKAFLVRVNYGEVEHYVALCIVGDRDRANRIVSEAGAVFHAMFARGVPLDIMLLNAEQQQRVEKVCQPFFRSETITN